MLSDVFPVLESLGFVGDIQSVIGVVCFVVGLSVDFLFLYLFVLNSKSNRDAEQKQKKMLQLIMGISFPALFLMVGGILLLFLGRA